MDTLDPGLRTWWELMAISGLVVSLLYLGMWMVFAVRIRVRRTRRVRASALPRLLPLVGLAIAAGPRQGDSHRLPLPTRPLPNVAPWLESDGWTPPRPSGSSPPLGSEELVKLRVPSTHPAIHPERRSNDQVLTPLFEREGRRDAQTRTGSRYSIAEGDSLWRIAQRELRTTDPAAIQNYWLKIFEINRSILGPDPDLIYPGQKITLPEHKD